VQRDRSRWPTLLGPTSTPACIGQRPLSANTPTITSHGSSGGGGGVAAAAASVALNAPDAAGASASMSASVAAAIANAIARPPSQASQRSPFATICSHIQDVGGTTGVPSSGGVAGGGSGVWSARNPSNGFELPRYSSGLSSQARDSCTDVSVGAGVGVGVGGVSGADRLVENGGFNNNKPLGPLTAAQQHAVQMTQQRGVVAWPRVQLAAPADNASADSSAVTPTTSTIIPTTPWLPPAPHISLRSQAVPSWAPTAVGDLLASVAVASQQPPQPSPPLPPPQPGQQQQQQQQQQQPLNQLWLQPPTLRPPAVPQTTATTAAIASVRDPPSDATLAPTPLPPPPTGSFSLGVGIASATLAAGTGADMSRPVTGQVYQQATPLQPPVPPPTTAPSSRMSILEFVQMAEAQVGGQSRGRTVSGPGAAPHNTPPHSAGTPPHSSRVSTR
jgi:hypothetical protein